VQDVRTALATMAVTHSTPTLQKAHNCLTRALRHAEGRDLVRRNVSALVDTPHGRQGRPSQALTVEQAAALLEAAEDSRLHAYIVLCLLTGVRSEEARALTWDHVDLDARTISVWWSVRAHGDTKTVRSRRTLRIPQIAVEALQEQLRRQAEERSTAGELWQEYGLVFTTTVGTPYESHNLRRDFRKVTAAAGLGARWVPKELRTSFVSMMSYQGVPVEEIARLAGHASSRTTEVVYRRELRPVITTGAEIMARSSSRSTAGKPPPKPPDDQSTDCTRADASARLYRLRRNDITLSERWKRRERAQCRRYDRRPSYRGVQPARCRTG
jgi:integrase